jgi:hypothetical protein
VPAVRTRQNGADVAKEIAMRRVTSCILLTFAAAAPARADVFVLLPIGSIRVGPPSPGRVLVQTPWVTVGVGARGPAVARQAPTLPPPAPAPAEPAFIPGAPPPVPLPIPVEVPVARAPTLNEFAAAFKPAPGRFEVVLQHPMTGQPVKVSFSLPPGEPKRVKVHKRELEFQYRGKDVTIRFLRGGDVRVRD